MAEALRARDRGTPQYGVFDGILEGGVLDAALLRAAAERIPTVPVDLRIEGGRFTLLFVDRVLPGAGLDVAAQDALLAALAEVGAAADPARPLESTLRAQLVHAQHVVETLFTVDGARAIVPVSRERARTAADVGPTGQGRDFGGLDAPFRGRSTKQGLLLAGLLVVAGGLAAWRTGYVDLVRGALTRPATDELEIGTGPFGDVLALEVDDRLAGWEVRVTRGAGFPATPEALDARIAAAETNAERAAARRAGEGGRAWVASLDGEGKALDAREIDLAELLDADGAIEVRLAAKPGVHGIRLALGDGTEERRD